MQPLPSNRIQRKIDRLMPPHYKPKDITISMIRREFEPLKIDSDNSRLQANNS